jgi:hypothetical protein
MKEILISQNIFNVAMTRIDLKDGMQYHLKI